MSGFKMGGKCLLQQGKVLLHFLKQNCLKLLNGYCNGQSMLVNESLIMFPKIFLKYF